MHACAGSLCSNVLGTKGGKALAAVLPQNMIPALKCAATFTPK